jgi:lipopolysaccharide biosynthesis glycosyltransferase
MRWFLGLNHDAPHFAAYADMAQVAIFSALKHTSLQPHLIFDGPDCDLTRWVRRQGGTVLFRQSFLKERLAELSRRPESPFASAHGNGVYLRAEIPDILRENAWDDARVLYTDNDVMFTPKFDPEAFPGLDCAFAVAAEGNPHDYSVINSGIMLINCAKMEEVNPVFKSFLRFDLPMAVTRDWDQHSYKVFFGRRFNRLEPTFNWKTYWGRHDDARIIHFHGPKPFLRDAIRAKACDPMHLSLVSDFYWECCEQFDRHLQEAKAR